MPRQPAAFPVIPGPPQQRLRPPPDLSEAEKAAFIDIVSDYAPEHFKRSDAAMLVVYVRACLAEREAAERLGTEGKVTGGKPSPWLSVQAQANKSMLTFARSLRLGPLARAPSRASRPSKPQRPLSIYEKMALEDGDDAA
jgi:phage terminase small subunit